MADGAHEASGPASSEPARIALQQGSGPASSDKGKLHVFISYSREDLDFADQLAAALDSSGFECLIDRGGISGGEDWKRRLGNLISEADTVVFVLSPSSARSEICAWEVEEAARLNKRILPVICRLLEGVSPPARLRDLNYIFFYKEPKAPGSGFGKGLASLVTALNTDFDWLREHTRYLERAIEWDKGGRAAIRLLSGNDILDAKAWAARRPKTAPEPTVLQLDFIRASEAEAEARLSEERKQLDAMVAAQAEREKALHDREEAVKQRAKVARVRNIALVVAIILLGLAAWFVRDSDQQQKAAEQHKTTAERRDIQLRFQGAGRSLPLNYDEVLAVQEKFAAKVEAEETKRLGKPGAQTAQELLNSSWYAFHAKEFRKAVTVTNRAHALFPNNLSIESNRAHALMFMGQVEEAKALYLAHKGEVIALKSGNKLWEQVIAEDFVRLREAGLARSMMADIEKELGIAR
jgi:tetratricopeptide (TPR) repeat protein